MEFLHRLEAGSVPRRVVTVTKDTLLLRVANHLRSKKMRVVGFFHFPDGITGGEVLFQAADQRCRCISSDELLELSKIVQDPHRALRLQKSDEEFKAAALTVIVHNAKPHYVLRFS